MNETIVILSGALKCDYASRTSLVDASATLEDVRLASRARARKMGKK